jgi:hypothetical protein
MVSRARCSRAADNHLTIVLVGNTGVVFEQNVSFFFGSDANLCVDGLRNENLYFVNIRIGASGVRACVKRFVC